MVPVTPSEAASTIRNGNRTADQLAGAHANAVNLARAASEAAAQGAQDTAFSEAMAQMEVTRLFVNDRQHILGSHATKHGEAAEAVEVGVRRARDALHSRPFSTDVEADRISRTDYWVGGDAVQSKFINGANKGLDHVLRHMEKYEEFGRDGRSYYHIPKDQFELISRVRAGDTAGLNENSVAAIQVKVAAIEANAGKPFDEVVKPGISTYSEVQQGKINETLDKHEQDLEEENEELKDQISVKHEPSVAEGLRVAATGGAIAGVFGFAASAFRKHAEEGKNIFRGDFTWQDWKEVGLDTGKAAGGGFVTGGAVYILTNYVGASAPLASAFVSTVKGLHSLVSQQRLGKLRPGEFEDQALLLCVDVAAVSLGSAIGQALIPVPVLGALIGSFATKYACDVLKDYSASGVQAMRQRMEEVQAGLDKQYQQKLREIEAMFLPSVAVMEFAFNIENNRALLSHSLTLARMQGVPEQKLIKSADEVLAFLMNPNAGRPAVSG